MLELFKNISAVVIALATSLFPSSHLGGGGTIPVLDQFTATTSPVTAITQRTYGKSVMLTGLSTGLCLSLDSNHVITTTTCGSGGGSSFGKSWEIDANNFLAPTTTLTVRMPLGFVSQASSTNVGDFNITGNATATSATTTNFFATTASSTNLFGSGLLTCNGSSFVQWSGGRFSCGSPSGSGTVTSVGASTPNSTLSLGGTNPVIGAGTISFDLNLAHANIWTASTTFVGGLSSITSTSTNATTTNFAITSLASEPLSVNASGVVSTTTIGSGISYGGLDGKTISNSGVLSVSCTTITCSGTNPASFSIGNSAISNAQLANSTISGVALGGTLNALTATNGTLTFSGSYDGTTARTVGLNLASANLWTASTTFVGGLSSVNSTSTNATSTTFALTGLATSAGTYLAVDANGVVIATTSPFAITSNASAYKAASNWAATTTLAGTPTYANGSSGVGATLTEVGFGALYIDGNSPVVGDRILVKNQTSGFQNGIYTVTATGSGIASYVLTRSTDFNNVNDIFPGVATYIIGGTVNAGDTYVLTNTGTIVVGSTSLTFAELGFGALSASSGITLTGNALSLSTINKGVLGASTDATVPTSQATSTLYGTGTGGQVLGWSNTTNGIAWVATSSSAGGGSQTPYTSNHDGAGFNLLNIGGITATSTIATSTVAASTTSATGTVITGNTGCPISVAGNCYPYITSTTSLAAMSTTTITFPAVGNHIHFTFQASTTSGIVPFIYLNGESTGTNYGDSIHNGSGVYTDAGTRAWAPGNQFGGQSGEFEITIDLTNNASLFKMGPYLGGLCTNATSCSNDQQGIVSWKNTTSKITSISVSTNNGSATWLKGAFMQVEQY